MMNKYVFQNVVNIYYFRWKPAYINFYFKLLYTPVLSVFDTTLLSADTLRFTFLDSRLYGESNHLGSFRFAF